MGTNSTSLGEVEDSSALGTKRCCDWVLFSNINEAKAYGLINIAKGSIVMSGIFLSSSLIFLASEEAGCKIVDDDDYECEEKVFGFKPGSLITNISTIAGILTALLMPVVGAMLDYTSHRKMVGILSALLLFAIQSAQIGTVAQTWFTMSILQAFAGLFYNVQSLVAYSYLPNIASEVGQDKMTDFSATFNILQFASSLFFLVTINVIIIALKLKDVTAAQISQAVCVVILTPTLGIAWKLMSHVPAKHELATGSNLMVAGFSRIWVTAKNVNVYYGRGLRWYFIALIFGEAGMNAFTTVTIVFMTVTLKASSAQLGTVFLTVFVTILPGSQLGATLSRKTNPIMAWKISILIFSIITISGAFVLDGPDKINFCYLWAAMWGFFMGSFYTIENLIFSLSLPTGEDEAGLTGLFVYCRNILVWLPPLIFTVLNEAGIGMQWGLFSLVAFFCISLICLQLMDPWDKVLEAANQSTAPDTKSTEDTAGLQP